MDHHPNGVAAEKRAPAYELLLLDPEGVRKFWEPVIRPGLERIKAKDRRSGHWEPEHVRMRIENGFARTIYCECWLIIQSNLSKPIGFLVTQAFNDEFLGVPLYLFIWMAWCESPALKLRLHRSASTLDRVLPLILPKLEARAKELGLRGIQGVSSRFPWMYRLSKYGFKVHQYIIRKDFSPERKK